MKTYREVVEMTVHIGEKAPDFHLTNQNGNMVSLTGFCRETCSIIFLS